MSFHHLISVEDLSFAYGDNLILSDVSFEIAQGEYVGIIGPNGGGKTTLLKLLLGFLTPNKGKIHIFGKKPDEVRKRLAYVPQTLRFDKLFPISALELISGGRISRLPWWGRYRKADKKYALEMLELVGMKAYKDQSIGSLSGGQVRRVLIARALASEPEILFLDEPTAGVDIDAEQSIYEILNGLKTKMSILMITHNLSPVLPHVSRIFCVQRYLKIMYPQEVCSHFAAGVFDHPHGKRGSP